MRIPRLFVPDSLCWLCAMVAWLPAQTAMTFDWERVAFQPNTAYGFTVGYDQVRREGVLFGGSAWNSYGALGETWSWDGIRWRERHPATRPTPRQKAAMAWDPNTQSLIMFGGTSDFLQHFNDTWQWSGSDWLPLTTTTAPTPRWGPRMATDPIRNRVVLFGGTDGIIRLQDTWEWDGAQWQQRFPARVPVGRKEHAMSWNPHTRRIAMFDGGTTLGATFLPADEWDGSNWIATPVTLIGGPTPAFVDATAVPDPMGRGVWMAGVSYSFNPNAPPPAMVQYLWDGKHLTTMHPATPIPDRAMYESMFLDTTRSEIVSFAGSVNTPTSLYTYVYNIREDVWRTKDPQVAPFGNVTFTHVPWDDAFLAFDVNHQLWRLDDLGFAHVCAGPTYNGNPIGAIVVADPLRRRIYALVPPGGFLYELSGTTWSLIPAAQHGLPPQCTPFAYDSLDDQFWCIHNSTTSNSRTLAKWNRTTLTSSTVIPISSPTRVTGAAHDSERNVVCVMTLENGSSLIREWDGAHWGVTSATPSNRPFADFVFFPGVGCVLVEGTSIWSWNGTQWQAITSSASPSDGVVSGLAYDQCRHRLRAGFQRIEPSPYAELWNIYLDDLTASPREPHPGTTIQFTVRSSSHAGQPWILVLSAKPTPGIPLTSLLPDPYRVLPLAPDALLWDSLAQGIRGVLDNQGSGASAIQVPNNLALLGLRCHACAVSVTPNLQLGLVSRPVDLYVAR